MKTKILSALFALATVSVAGLCYAAWRPVTPPSQPESPVAVPALERPSVVVESSAVLVLAKPVREAPKARPVAAKPKKTVDCSNARLRTVEDTALGTRVLFCRD